jgi:hypothetical protein
MLQGFLMGTGVPTSGVPKKNPPIWKYNNFGQPVADGGCRLSVPVAGCRLTKHVYYHIII